MSDANNDNEHFIVLDGSDNAVLADAVFTESAQLRSVERLTSRAGIFRSCKPFAEKSQDAPGRLRGSLLSSFSALVANSIVQPKALLHILDG